MELACSVCDFKLQSEFVAEWSHPLLHVALCTECKDRWEASDAAKAPVDASAAAGHDDCCVWCGRLGELTCCDTCSKTVCAGCFSRADVAPPSEDETFACYACNGAAIAPYAAALEEYHASLPPVAEDADAPSDAGKQVRLDALLRCESERDDALQHLEDDCVKRTRAAIEAELGKHVESAVVDDEVAAWTALWHRLSDELSDASTRMQCALEAEGVDTARALRAYDRSGARVANEISTAWVGLDVVDENGERPPSPVASEDEDSQLERTLSSVQRHRDAVAADKERRKEHKQRRKATKAVAKREDVCLSYDLVNVEHPRAVRAGAQVRQVQEESNAVGRVREDAAPGVEGEKFTICVVRSSGAEFDTLTAIEVEVNSDGESEHGAASSAAASAAASAASTSRWVSLGVPETVTRTSKGGYPEAVYTFDTPMDFKRWRKRTDSKRTASVVARLVSGRGASGDGGSADGNATNGEEEEEGLDEIVHELTGWQGKKTKPRSCETSHSQWKKDVATAVSKEDSALSMLKKGDAVTLTRVEEKADAMPKSKRARRAASAIGGRLSCTRAVAPPARAARRKPALPKTKSSGGEGGVQDESEGTAMKPEDYVTHHVRLQRSGSDVAAVDTDGEAVLFTGTVQRLDPGDDVYTFTVRFEDRDYRCISCGPFSQFDSLPLTSLTRYRCTLRTAPRRRTR